MHLPRCAFQILAVTLTQLGVAQEPDSPPPVTRLDAGPEPQAPIEMSVDPDVGLPLTDFAKLTAHLIGSELDLSTPGIEFESVRWAGTLRTPRRDARALFDAMAHRLGYDATLEKGILRLTPSANPTRRIRPNPKAFFAWPIDLVQHVAQVDRVVFTSVAIARTDPQSTAERLVEVAPEEKLGQVASTRGAVLIQGPAAWVETVAQLASHLDVPDEAPMEKVADGFAFTEGPAWDPNRGVLLFTDIRNNRIVELGDEDAISIYREPSGRANGLAFDRDGNLYACLGGERRLTRYAANGKSHVLASSFDGKALNSPNDLALDDAGGIYFTDPRYGNADDLEQKVMGVSYIAADGELTRVVDAQKRPNGIAVSNDGKILFVAEPDDRKILAYSIETPGKLGKPRTFFQSAELLDGGGPDGMALDANGNLYATYGSVLVIDPVGELLRRIPVAERPSNCTFGGQDGTTLFVTARTGLYRKQLSVRGAPLR